MPASIDADGLAGNEVGLTEKDHRFRDFGLAAPDSASLTLFQGERARWLLR